MKITLQARPIRCALCHDEAYGALGRCALCGTLAHQDCFASLGRCPTLGCRGRLPLPQPVERVDLRAWLASAGKFVLSLLLEPCGCWVAVLVILGVIGALAVPAESTSSGANRDTCSEQIRAACWTFRERRGRLPQTLAELDEARLGPRYAAPLSRTRYSLARDQRRLLLVWTQGRETRALEIGPLTSSLNVAAVASGD